MANENETTPNPEAEKPASETVNAAAANAPADVKMDEVKLEEVTASEPEIANAVQKGELLNPNKLEILNDVHILLTIEIGRAQIKIRDLLALNKGSIIELDKLAGEPVDVYANGKLISMGNIITANGKNCVRLMSVPDKNQHS